MIEWIKRFFKAQCTHCFHKEIKIEDAGCKKGTKYIERHIFVCCHCSHSEQAVNYWGRPQIYYKERKTTYGR